MMNRLRKEQMREFLLENIDQLNLDEKSVFILTYSQERDATPTQIIEGLRNKLLRRAYTYVHNIVKRRS